MALAKEESHRLVKRLISLQLQDATHRHLFTMHGIRGQIAHDRLMMIARHSLVDTAFDTEAHRDILEYEAQIPTQVFFDRVNIPGWIGLKPDLFYETDSDWKASVVSTMPSATDITNEAVHELLGYSGGGGEGSDNPFPATSVADRRLQQVCEWALTEYPKAVVHDYGASTGIRNDDLSLRQMVTVFRGFVYNTLYLAMNPVNLEDTKWNLLKGNLRSWHDFAKYLAPENARSLAQSSNEFYNGAIVWIWNQANDRTLLKVRNNTNNVLSSETDTFFANAIPDFGEMSNRLQVRKLLNLNIPYEAHLADLSALTAADQDDNDLLILPAFDSDVLAYTAEIDQTVESITVSPTTASNLAAIEVDGDLNLTILPETFSIHIVSEDGEVTKTYTLTVSRNIL